MSVERHARIAAAGFLGGLAVGLVVWSTQVQRSRRELFSRSPVRRYAALDSVPVDQRRSLLMAYAGFTALEVAAVEQIPVGTAKTRIRAGMRKLRAAYLGELDEEVAP